jgi:signal transduction histidine kinase
MERGLSQIRLSGRPVALEYTLGDGPALRHFEGRLVSAGPDRVLGLVRDVTERHQMEWALSQARKSESLEMMAGGTAHDLNNLFQGLVGYLDLALADPPHSGDRTLLLQRMQGLLQRGIKLSGELLLYTGRGFRMRESLNLQALVAADASADSVRCESHEAEPRIEGDPDQIARLIRILVENALEATPKGSRKPHLLIDRIEVGQMEREEGLWPRTPDPGRYLMLQVEDEGEGITDEGLNQIFDPFYSTRGVGRGLGLSAALGIVRGHGGFIQVVSRRGEGTRIRVLFPVDPA